MLRGAQHLLEGRFGIYGKNLTFARSLPLYRQLILSSERFSFSQNPAKQLITLAQEGALDLGVVAKTIQKHPYPKYWIEMPPSANTLLLSGIEEDLKIGMLIHDVPHREERCAMVFVIASDVLIPVTLFAMKENAMHRAWHIFTEVNPDDFTAQQIDAFLSNLQVEVISAIFTLIVPKLVEYTPCTHPPKLVRARQRSGRPGLLEYRNVTMNIGIRVQNVSETQASGEECLRRLHQVIGHFRTLTKGRDEPHLSWVPPHWRGDASQGVIIHNRNVTTKG